MRTFTNITWFCHGFGFGVWRTMVTETFTIWTVCLGPVSIALNRSNSINPFAE